MSTVRKMMFQLSGADGGPLRGDVRTAGDGAGRPAVVICHGFKGFKDWGFFPYLSASLAERTGHPVVSFNFSGSGIGPDLERFTDTNGFARNTFSKEIEDLEALLDGLAAGQLGEISCRPVRHFGLLGHSRGGATAILVAERRPEVRTVVTWSAIASVARYEETFATELEAEGVAWVLNTRTGERLPLFRDVLDDIRENRQRFDVLAAAGRLEVPLLVVHGSDDEAVPAAEAHLLSAAAPGAELAIIGGASHTMDASHPFPGSNERLEEAIARTADYLRKNLTGGSEP